MYDQVEATVTKTMTETVTSMIADLEANPPQTLPEARTRLQELRAALRSSIEEKWAATKSYDSQPADARAAIPDYQAVLSEVSVRVEAVEVVVKAIADLMQAEATAAAALTRIFKTLHAPRIEARVWQKLTPATV